MKNSRFSRASIWFALGFFIIVPCLSGCEPAEIAGATAAATLLGARTPAQEIRQVYYLGVFDAREQLPSTIYRLTIHGQASLISSKRFASGWLPANMVDSLNTTLGFDEHGVVVTKKEQNTEPGALKTGRRLILFGPEGFREAPRDHRLVLVMSSNPEKFFNAVGNTLGTLAHVQVQRLEKDASKEVIMALSRTRLEKEKLLTLQDDIKEDITVPREGR